MIPLNKVVLSDKEIAAANQVLQSGNLRQGKVTTALEEAFAKEVGAQFAVAVSSGTAALHLPYMEFLKPGDEILVPTFTFIATASMASMVGAKPVFCDVDSRTFTLDVADARSRITPRTKAVAPVHLFGNPCDMEGIAALAREFDLKIVWDAAQAHGTKFRGKDIGSFDQAVAYSFYPSKNMFVGEGGIITTNDARLFEKMKLTRSHGQAGKYVHSCLGFNYRMTDVEAAIGLQQLSRLGDMVARRRANGAFLSANLAKIPAVQPPLEQLHGSHSYNQYSIVLDLDALTCTRDEFTKHLNELGVGTGVHYPRCLHQQPIFQELYGSSKLPVAEKLTESILALPVHPLLTEIELQQIVRAVQQACEKFAK
jgi:perosamine synthetase